MKPIASLLLLVSLLFATGMPLPRPVHADPRITEHLPLARAMARKFVRRVAGMLEFEDLVSIAMVAMWKSAATFDAERGLTFGQYAERCIWNDLRHEQTRVWTERRRAWLAQTPIDPQDDDDRGIQLQSHQRSPFELLSDARRSHRIRAAVATLPAGPRESIEHCFFEELSFVEAAEREGVSKQGTQQRQRKAIALLATKLRAVRDDEEGSGSDHG